MTKVPEYNLPKFGKWTPDKSEVHNMRYWKAKKARVKPVTRSAKKPKKPKLIDKTLSREDYDHHQHLRQLSQGVEQFPPIEG